MVRITKAALWLAPEASTPPTVTDSPGSWLARASVSP